MKKIVLLSVVLAALIGCEKKAQEAAPEAPAAPATAAPAAPATAAPAAPATAAPAAPATQAPAQK